MAVSITGKSRGEKQDIPSIQDLAAVLITTNAFRAAYDGNDKQALEQVTTSQFFKGALASADLRSFPHSANWRTSIKKAATLTSSKAAPNS